MMVRAEVVLICTDKGIAANLVDPAVYPFVFFIIIATSILAPLFLKLSYKNEKNPLGNTPTPTPTTTGVTLSGIKNDREKFSRFVFYVRHFFNVKIPQ